VSRYHATSHRRRRGNKPNIYEIFLISLNYFLLSGFRFSRVLLVSRSLDRVVGGDRLKDCLSHRILNDVLMAGNIAIDNSFSTFSAHPHLHLEMLALKLFNVIY
jgi:hypothetical protein